MVPMPAMGTHFTKVLTDMVGNRKKGPVEGRPYNARTSAFRADLLREHIMKHLASISNKERPPPFAYLLSDQEPSQVVNTILGNLLLGSCLAYQLQDFGRSNIVFATNNITTSVDLNMSTAFLHLPTNNKPTVYNRDDLIS